METKRFIGNDMSRLYDRVRKELGRDAVILRTRTLARDGSSPLIELVAGREQENESERLDVDIQRTMLDAVGSRLARTGKVTVAELEAMLEEQSPPPQRMIMRPATVPAEVTTAHIRARREDELPLDDGVRPLLPALERLGRRASEDEVARLRILEQGQAANLPSNLAAVRKPRVEATLSAAQLQASGLTPEAIEVVLRDAGADRNPVRAIAGVLKDREVTFPEADVTALVMVLGSPGSGRTTALMKMALDCADSGREAILVAADGQRMGARQQVHAFAEAAGLDVLDAADARQVSAHAAKVRRGACLFVDVPPGAFEPPPLPGVVCYTYLALPAHWQSEAMEMGLVALQDCAFDGCVLTFTDLAPSLGQALSLVLDSPLGIAFVSTGRDLGEGMGNLDFEALASGLFPPSTGERTNGKLVASA